MCFDIVLATSLIDPFESLIISSQKIIYRIKIIYGTKMNSMKYSCQMQSIPMGPLMAFKGQMQLSLSEIKIV